MLRLYVGQSEVHNHGKVFICTSSKMHTNEKVGIGRVIFRWLEWRYYFLLTENKMTGDRYLQ